jgi:hypothetical protein
MYRMNSARGIVLSFHFGKLLSACGTLVDKFCLISVMWVFRRLFPESYSQQYRNKIGLIGLQDFADGDSVVLKLCEVHAVRGCVSPSGDGVGDETLHRCSLAVGTNGGSDTSQDYILCSFFTACAG